MRVLFCLIRNTYGYARKECDFSNSFVAKGTGLSKSSIIAVMNSLQEGKVIEITQQSTFSSPRKVKLNKHIEEWSTILPQWQTSTPGIDITTSTGTDICTTTGIDVCTQKRKNIKKEYKEIVGVDSNKPPYKEIIDYLNDKAGKAYRWQGKATQGHINARFAEGYTLKDFQKVIDNKAAEWKGGKMEQYLRPETLFGNKFEGYLNQGKESEENGTKVRESTADFYLRKYGISID
jgi:uncharacterized phage protein (TIGR02220 family)